MAAWRIIGVAVAIFAYQRDPQPHSRCQNYPLKASVALFTLRLIAAYGGAQTSAVETGMENDIARLTEIQKKILRLVAEAKTSKEIALETDLTPMTVDQYIHRAMLILGAGSRREAARQMVEWEASQELRRFEFKPALLAEPQETANPSSTVRSSNWLAALRLPPTGGKPNDLDSVARLFAIFRIALVSTVVSIAIIIIAKGAFVLLS